MFRSDPLWRLQLLLYRDYCFLLHCFAEKSLELLIGFHQVVTTDNVVPIKDRTCACYSSFSALEFLVRNG